MPVLKLLGEVRSDIKSGESVFFATPLILVGGVALYREHTNVRGQCTNGMIRFAEPDPYFEGRSPMIALSKIRDDQQVIV